MEMNALPSEEGEVALAVPAAAAGVCAGQKLLLLPVPLGMSTLWFVRLFVWGGKEEPRHWYDLIMLVLQMGKQAQRG